MGWLRISDFVGFCRKVEWVNRLAHVISAVASPAVLVSLVLLSTPLRSPSATWGAAVVATVFTTGIPWCVLACMKWAGKVSDLHVTRREQRWPLLLVCLGSLVTGLLILGLGMRSSTMVIEVALVLLGLLVTGAVTLVWKISLHAAVAAYCSLHVLAGSLLGAHLAMCFVLVVAWARVRIRHHTSTQVTAGAIVGALISLVGWLLPHLG